MIEQIILHLIVKSSLLYVIRNRIYIVNAGKTAHFLVNFTLQFWVEQTEETKHIDNGRKNSSESSCYAYIYCYFYVFTQLYKSLKY